MKAFSIATSSLAVAVFLTACGEKDTPTPDLAATQAYRELKGTQTAVAATNTALAPTPTSRSTATPLPSATPTPTLTPAPRFPDMQPGDENYIYFELAAKADGIGPWDIRLDFAYQNGGKPSCKAVPGDVCPDANALYIDFARATVARIDGGPDKTVGLVSDWFTNPELKKYPEYGPWAERFHQILNQVDPENRMWVCDKRDPKALCATLPISEEQFQILWQRIERLAPPLSTSMGTARGLFAPVLVPPAMATCSLSVSGPPSRNVTAHASWHQATESGGKSISWGDGESDSLRGDADSGGNVPHLYTSDGPRTVTLKVESPLGKACTDKEDIQIGYSGGGGGGSGGNSDSNNSTPAEPVDFLTRSELVACLWGGPCPWDTTQP